MVRKICLLVLLTITVTGCGAPFRDDFASPIDGTLTVQPMDTPRPAAPPYLIQNGDSLAIRFYRNPELNNDVVVRPDGMISLPLIDDVPAEGLTPQDLGKNLEGRYQGELAVPDVTVIVSKFGGQRVFVGGEVDKTAELDLVPGLTVLSAIMKAGGFKNSARIDQVILIRREADGKPKGTSLDLTDVVGGTHPEQDVELRPYDIVVVPRSTVSDVNTFMDLYITRNLPFGPLWIRLLTGGI
jgi:polysaccharide export outer membrane protein